MGYVELTRRELMARLAAAAEPVYGAREATAIARLVAERRYGLSRADVALFPGTGIDPGEGFEALLADLAAARPVQYILGVADFDGWDLAVGEGVLIPRPETEEIVRWVSTNCELRITNFLRPINILDIGTGSGAIAIALAKRLPGALVAAMDVSPEALRYARINNERLGAGVEIIQGDIFDPDNVRFPHHATPPPRFAGRVGSVPDESKFDIIVSNPPYIPQSERAAMAPNVTEYEPASALFVPDGDSLVFYRAIAKFARRNLSSGGELYFEIHETAARAMIKMLEDEGFSDIIVRNDINSKPRMIKCTTDSERK
jgi:release factor glutamine methyltransferase